MYCRYNLRKFSLNMSALQNFKEYKSFFAFIVKIISAIKKFENVYVCLTQYRNRLTKVYMYIVLALTLCYVPSSLCMLNARYDLDGPFV